MAQVLDQPWQVMAEDADFAWLTAELETADFLIDGLLGTGVTRPIEGRMADLLRHVADLTGLAQADLTGFENLSGLVRTPPSSPSIAPAASTATRVRSTRWPCPPT
jgi:hypothetical protein